MIERSIFCLFDVLGVPEHDSPWSLRINRPVVVVVLAYDISEMKFSPPNTSSSDASQQMDILVADLHEDTARFAEKFSCGDKPIAYVCKIGVNS